MKYIINFNDRRYEVEVEVAQPMTLADFHAYAPAAAPIQAAPAAAAPAPAAQGAAVTAGGSVVEAPMPGNILKVNAAVGQQVKAGAVLVVLEAMKMENEILAPVSGTVSQVLVTKGATVETGAPLVVIG